MQLKLSAVLRITEGRFEVVDRGGRYILKPPSLDFPELPENEDMHLKLFSLISRNQKVELAPAYDFLNTTIALKNAREEMALPLKGKKSRLTRNGLLHYLATERLQINERVLSDVLGQFAKAMPLWRESLDKSFLSAESKQKFLVVLDNRARRM